MNNNPKNNNLMSKNIRQKILTILEYFDASVCNPFLITMDAYICHQYQPIIIQ